jgi:hypothetical protein
MSQRTGVKTHRVWLSGRLMRARERKFKGDDIPLVALLHLPSSASLTYLTFHLLHRTE